KKNGFMAQTVAGMIMPIMGNISNITTAITTVVAGIFCINGKISLGTITIFSKFSKEYSRPITEISNQFNVIQSGIAGAERIFNLIDENNEICDNLEYNKQPIILNNLVLVFNGEIYNFNKLEEFLKENDENYSKPKSDSQLLANLINYYYNSNDENLLESVKSVINELDADYSFAVYDKKHDNLAISRDPIGVKPLFYGMDEEKDFKVFASEKKALWKAGIADGNIHDLTPGCILYNWKTVDLEDNLIKKLINTDFKEIKSNYNEYKDFLETKDSYEVYKELLRDDLYSAVEKRVNNISNIGLIFSGGVDSTILAVLLKQIAEKRNNEDNSIPLNIKLYSVGVENSQDIRFSKEIAEELDLPIKTIIIDETTVKESIKPVLTAIEDDNVMKLGVGMTIYLAAKAMKEDNVKVALSGQGADELFGGYNRYLKHFEENSLFDAYFALDEEIYHDIANMYHVNLERDDAVSMANGVELRVPFLDMDIIDLSLDIPGIYKIKDNEDILRKHILRDVAKSIGVPDYIADRPKKAAQYGSGINKILKKKVLRSFDIEEFIENLKKN
uniref:asparagine synthase-related protein n=1 Tax=uncultured Methanobrevibacter sp. TaxID=253161 RepID=UPI00262550EB